VVERIWGRRVRFGGGVRTASSSGGKRSILTESVLETPLALSGEQLLRCLSFDAIVDFGGGLLVCYFTVQYCTVSGKGGWPCERKSQRRLPHLHPPPSPTTIVLQSFTLS